MGTLAQELDSMIVKAHSPDQKIGTIVSNRTKISLKFSPQAYKSYSEEGLEHQLSRLAEVAWVRWQREHESVLKSHNMLVMKPETATDEDTRRFLETRFSIDSFGSSNDNAVRVKTRGLRQWKTRIKPGALDTLSEDEFCRSALQAVSAVIADYNQKNEAYKHELHL